MKWLWFALALLMPGGLLLYAFGMWYAGVTPRQLVKGIKDGRPIETSPKYAEWARKMEEGRTAQAEEERDKSQPHPCEQCRHTIKLHEYPAGRCLEGAFSCSCIQYQGPEGDKRRATAVPCRLFKSGMCNHHECRI